MRKILTTQVQDRNRLVSVQVEETMDERNPKMIQCMNGTLTLKSAVGEGSAFTVALRNVHYTQRAPHAAHAAHQPRVDAEGRGPGKPVRVVHVREAQRRLGDPEKPAFPLHQEPAAVVAFIK